MALAEVLAIGTAAADSADVSPTALTRYSLKSAAGPGIPSNSRVSVQVKDDAGQYFGIEELSDIGPTFIDLQPGTYRFSRFAGGAVGVFSAA